MAPLKSQQQVPIDGNLTAAWSQYETLAGGRLFEIHRCFMPQYPATSFKLKPKLPKNPFLYYLLNLVPLNF